MRMSGGYPTQEPEKGDQQPCPFDLFIQMDFICFLVLPVCAAQILPSFSFHAQELIFFFWPRTLDPNQFSPSAGKLCIIRCYIRTQERLVE